MTSPSSTIPTDFLASNIVLEVNDSPTDSTAPATELDSCDIKPVSVLFIRQNGKVRKKPLSVLFDTGAKYSCVKAESSQWGTIRRRQRTTFATPNGLFTTSKKSEIEFNLTEFSESKVVKWNFHVLPESQPLPYDIIIGRDLMKELNMDVLYSQDVVTWDGIKLPMQKIQDSKWKDLNLLDDDPEAVKVQSKRLQRILDNTYAKANLDKEVSEMTHLTDFQRVILLASLKKQEELFDGTLGKWNGPDVDIPLKDGAKPYHTRAFPIPVILLAPFKKYLDRLVSIGVLTKVNRSEWAAPSFIIPKKDGKVRLIRV